MGDSSHVRLSGPLAVFAAGYAQSLRQQGYTRNSTTEQVRLLAHLSRWLSRQGLTVHGLCSADLDRFLRARRRRGYGQYLTWRALQPVLTYLRDRGVTLTPQPVTHDAVSLLLGQYCEYLLHERGLAPGTVRHYADAVRPFLQGRTAANRLTVDWGSLEATDVTAFVVSRTAQQSRGTAQFMVTALRSLLRFLHVHAMIARPLAAAVPAVTRWRLASLPKSLTSSEVRALLASCDRRTGAGRRDFAVLTTLVSLGVRAGELAALRLEDIDWHDGTLIVRGKGHTRERLPLPTSVGQAIVSYLRRGRPATATSRTVFVRVRAPHHALTAAGLTQIVCSAACRAGLGPIYAHRLRHTAATQMLRAGVGLPEIGQVLRHRHLLTTAIYAKVDRQRLRTIARVWPGGVA
jgi:site-specific recombinase XerD